jgi:hypothetical protein
VSAESDANILSWITGKAERNAAVRRTDIKNYWREVCKIELKRRWVDSFIARHCPELIEKKSSPPGEPRLQVRRVFLNQTICSLHEAVQDRQTDLAFNVHEVVMSTWDDGQPNMAVVPSGPAPSDSSLIISECETCLGGGFDINECGVSHSVRGDVS